MKRILMTGGSGFIARHFHEALSGHEIVNFDRRAPKHRLHSEYFQGDMRNLADVERVFQKGPFDYVLHLAAEHQDFGISEKDYFDTNETGAKNLTDVATKFGHNKIIFYSSVAVYGDQVVPTSEETPPNPSNFYGASKLAGEKVFLKWSEKSDKNQLLMIRPGVVYGEWNMANMFRLITQVHRKTFVYFGRGQNIKSIAYVKNLVDATIYLIKKMSAGVAIYNYADNPQMTSRQIVEQILKALPRPYQPLTVPLALGYILAVPFDLYIRLTGKNFPISSNRIKKLCAPTHHTAPKIALTEFSPRFDNAQGISRMVDWYVNHYQALTK